MKNLSNMNCVIAGVQRFFLIGIDIGNLTSASIWECILVKNPANVINEVTLLHSFPSWPYIFQHTQIKNHTVARNVIIDVPAKCNWQDTLEHMQVKNIINVNLVITVVQTNLPWSDITENTLVWSVGRIFHVTITVY